MKKYATLAAALLLAACATTQTAEGVNAESANSAIAAAEAATKKTGSVHYLWRDTEKLLKQAKAAAKAKDYKKATDLANTAKRQSELAYAQYEEQKQFASRF